MNQQTVRYLVKTYGDMVRGSAIAKTRTVEYLRAATKPDYLQNRWTVSKAEDLWKDSQAVAHLLAAFEQRAATLLAALAQDLASKNSSWNKSLSASRASSGCSYTDDKGSFIQARMPFRAFHDGRNIGEFLESGFTSIAQAQLVRTASDDVVAQLRPDANALVDAFGFSDYHLNSALGGYDGNVYETMVEWVSRNPLNLGVHSPVVEGYEQFYKPLIHGLRPSTETLQARL
ncbi:acyl-CoA dehydrogenase/oxidase C-terminal [Geranomyces variabilis]|nr:acyl-CoA dehydrogenase/oxidase C-terminal [Geranomyces variabilis]